MKKVFILAGAGWLGHRIANKLAENEYGVAVQHLSMDEKFVPNMRSEIKHIVGDVRDELKCLKAIESIKPDIVIDVHPHPDYIEKYYNMLAGKVEHYLLCSSAGVYVPTGKVSVDENATTYSISEFGTAFIAKRKIDEKAMSFNHNDKFPVTIVRPGIILGRSMFPLELWGLRNPEFFKQVANGKTIRISNQTDVILSAVNVDDAAEIFVKSVMNPKKSKGQIFNAVSWTMNHGEYMQTILNAMNVKPVIEHIPTEKLIEEHINDPKFSLPDYNFFMSDLAVSGEKARKLLSVTNEASLETVLRESLKSVGAL